MDRRNATALLHIAHVARRLGHLPQAAAALTAALALAPNEPGLHYDLAEVFAEAGLLATARGSFMTAWALQPLLWGHAKRRADEVEGEGDENNGGGGGGGAGEGAKRRAAAIAAVMANVKSYNYSSSNWSSSGSAAAATVGMGGASLRGEAAVTAEKEAAKALCEADRRYAIV